MASPYLTLDDVDCAGKRVLLRGDLNVPVENGVPSDTTRLQRLVKTIRDLTAKKARVIVLSHFGRPKAGVPDAAFSLKPVADALGKLVQQPVAFCDATIGPSAEAAVNAMKPGDILVLENTRFHAGEEKNDPEFVKALAKLGDVFVNDAFSVAHRAHATTEGLAHVLPACAGRDMEAELSALELALGNPQKPLMAVVGGSKISTKINVLTNLVEKVDVLVLGGGMANTFLAAQGAEMGKSLVEKDMLDTARKISETAQKKGCRIILPADAAVAAKFEANAPTETVSSKSVPADKMALDVGTKAVEEITAALQGMKTVVWNGPLGAFETPPFHKGTVAVAKAVAELTQAGKIRSVAGGGDTVAVLNLAGVGESLSYLSTAGGAFLEWLEGCALPGVEALRRSPSKSYSAAAQ